MSNTEGTLDLAIAEALQTRDMSLIQARIKDPPVISRSTLEELGSECSSKPKASFLQPQADTPPWDSPAWVLISNPITPLSVQNSEQHRGLRALFADVIDTAPSSTPFVFHSTHTNLSVCGDRLKPDAVMSLRSKPCVPLTSGAIVKFYAQDGDYDCHQNIGNAILHGRVFLQQLPRTLREKILVVLTDLHSITLISVQLTTAGNLTYEMSERLSDVKGTLLQLLNSKPERWHVHMPDLGPALEVTGLLGSGTTSHVYAVSIGKQQAVAKVPIAQDLAKEYRILQSLQGIAGVPRLLQDHCVGGSIVMEPVLVPLTRAAVHMYNIHTKIPAFVQMLQAAHAKQVVNRGLAPRNLMYSVAESVVYLVDWGSATTPNDERWEGTLHYTSTGNLQQLVSWYKSPEDFRMFHTVKVTPADDLESLVANMFCITHPAAHDELELLAHEPAAVLDWWCQMWATRSQWQRAVLAARATDYDLLAAQLQTLME